ncbi:MAG: 30S ribosomal protein S16 [Acidobacteria bacterium CG_4_9_14_3_um_filter_49_7]|nr:MAG: 30S ribosomal protein S16 [Acidobacteria bacterium CG_4_9_14_3_um_filter_49_7]
MIAIRLKRMGRKKNPFYRIVVSEDSNTPTGRFVEEIGHYDPLARPVELKIDKEKAMRWLQEGAKVSDTVKSLFKKENIG